MAAVPQPTGNDIRAKLEDIFARPEFSSDTGDTWLDELAKLLGSVFTWLGGLHAAAPLLFWLLVLVTGVLLLALSGYIGWAVRRALFTSGRRAADASERERRERLSGTYLEEAGRLAERQDFTEAIRCLFLALVYRFDETGRVSFQRAYTNREYLGLFEDNPSLRDHLKVFVDILDDHWYGQQPTTSRRYQDCRALYETIT
jgi:hypothetical protein